MDNWERDCRNLKKICRQIAAAAGEPRFYTEKKLEMQASLRSFEVDPMVRSCLGIAMDHGIYLGHGGSHIRKVAIDAGAIILIEGDLGGLLRLSHIAGVLHDICRSKPDHARAGAQEACRILKSFDLLDEERRMIVCAIRNHEAFKTAEPLGDPASQLLSDALYDADKFRWGPDNFTEMLWDIIDSRKIAFDILFSRFPAGLEATERLRGSFRTRTGKEYGPDFIDRGLEIGRKLQMEFERMLNDPGKGSGG
ncbi:MAG: hypothetical protein ACE14T_01830 [Syntrophales bacterium]